MKNVPTTFSTNSSPVQPQQNETIFNLEDISDHTLLTSLGCYRLPSGFFSDDSIAMAELRKAGGATGAVTAFIAYYVGFADLVAVGGITLPLGKLA